MLRQNIFKLHFKHRMHRRISVLFLFVIIGFAPALLQAAPYAAYVMDARTGKTIFEQNADTRLHPASLTKMMTLYLAFQAIEQGKISLDTMVKISPNAAGQPPSRLGLKAGQKIALRHLIRAAAIKSANDAAAAIAEALGGNTEQFAVKMNRTARAIGMRNTTFVNANGLTAPGHLSTAHDMSILGRRLFYDFPQYYNVFSRRESDAGLSDVLNTNRKFLDSYEGADGIKTGFTNAAGFNLTASAERRGVRIIATVFGATSTPQRNAKMAELLDMGFAKIKPGQRYSDNTSPTPKPEPIQSASLYQQNDVQATEPIIDPVASQIAAQVATGPMQSGINNALMEANGTDAGSGIIHTAANDPPPAASRERPAETITKTDGTGSAEWGIHIGRFKSRDAAERALMQTMLEESATLDQTSRAIHKSPKGFEAYFTGLTRKNANLACRRLQARGIKCEPSQL